MFISFRNSHWQLPLLPTKQLGHMEPMKWSSQAIYFKPFKTWRRQPNFDHNFQFARANAKHLIVINWYWCYSHWQQQWLQFCVKYCRLKWNSPFVYLCLVYVSFPDISVILSHNSYCYYQLCISFVKMLYEGIVEKMGFYII